MSDNRQEFEEWYASIFLSHIPDNHKPVYFQFLDGEYTSVHISGAYSGWIAAKSSAIYTDNSAVIANMQKTINEKDALIAIYEKHVSLLPKNPISNDILWWIVSLNQALALSSPVSEKAK